MTAGGARSAKNGEPGGGKSSDEAARVQRRASDDPEDATSQDYFNEPSARPPVRGAPAARSDGNDTTGRVTDAIERLSDRIESAESRQALAIAGVERSVRDVIARIDASEREQMHTATRVENEVQAVRTDSKRLAERLRRLETEGGPGLKSVEALRALETAVGKVAGHIQDSERRSQQSLDEIRTRMERFEAAEDATVSAIRELRNTSKALDERLSLVDNDGQNGIERLAENLSHRVEQVREELAKQLAAAADARFDRVEEALARMSEHVRDAEQRSAGAIERMGREVLDVAQTLSRRVQSVEQHSVELGDRMGADMSRVATAVEARLVRSDTIQAQALEKLGDEIARVTERLAERITTAERRSAEAMDDIGEQVARVTERISHRHERYTSELADRIRQSEDRTAKLLDEARNRLDGRPAESLRPSAPAAPPFLAAPDPARDETLFLDAPFPIQQPLRAFEPLRATPVPSASPVRVFGQAGRPRPQPAAEFTPLETPDANPRPENPAAAIAEAPEAAPPIGVEGAAESLTAVAAGLAPAVGTPEASINNDPAPAALSSDGASGFALPEDEALFEESAVSANPADPVSEIPTESAAPEENAAFTQLDSGEDRPQGPWDLSHPDRDSSIDTADEDAKADEVAKADEAAESSRAVLWERSTAASETPSASRWTWRGYDDDDRAEGVFARAEPADEPFGAETRPETRDGAGPEPDLEPVELEPNVGFDDENDFETEPTSRGPRLPSYRFSPADHDADSAAAQSEPPPALTTRDIIDRARAAARSAHERDRTWRPATPANERAPTNGAVLRTRLHGPSGMGGLLVASLVAAVGIAGGGFVLFEGRPAADSASGAQASAGGAHTPPLAAMALAPRPAAAAIAKDMTSDYSRAVAEVTAGQPAGLTHLQKLADVGYAPAQFYLAELYQDGKAGLKKDSTQSRHWLERAADGGDRTAMHNLALDEHEGIGGSRDAATAAEWFRRAADLGLLDSQFNLAALYERGDGVARNFAEAYKWYLIAGRAGDPEARAGAQRVRASLSADERQVAEQAAAAFQPTQSALPSPAQPGAAPGSPDLMTAQRALNQLGYYQGPMDGSASPAIHLAIAAYQRDQGLPITGSPDTATLAKLSKP